jgi:penicillin-binding protein 2
VFVSEEGRRQRAGLLANRDGMHRMRHRAFMEQYPPGSVFKVMMAIAALEEGVINPSDTEFCPGHFSLGGARWRCWKRGGHGSVAVIDSLAYSCDVFFYNVGLELGIDRIHDWGTRMGLGGPTGLDLPGEVVGVLPTPEWKMENYTHLNIYDRQWQKGDTVNLAIGQGMCSLTPMQTTVMMACMVNGGRRITPYINAERPTPVSDPFISPAALEIVQAGMLKCVTKHDYPSGTGRRADIEGYAILGKTGTAQTVPLSWVEGMSDEEIPYNLRDHAWFVAGVLDRDPPIAITVLYERGQHGSSAAAPLARDVILAFYEGQTLDSPLQVARGND